MKICGWLGFSESIQVGNEFICVASPGGVVGLDAWVLAEGSMYSGCKWRKIYLWNTS
jgi:hypothetical protein